MTIELSYIRYAQRTENMYKYVWIEPQSLTVLAKHDKIIGSFLTT